MIIALFILALFTAFFMYVATDLAELIAKLSAEVPALPTVQAGECGTGSSAGDSVATVPPRLTAAAGATVFDQEADACDCFLCAQPGDAA